MSGMKSKLLCLVWPDDKPDEHTVQVKIDDGDTVATLKDMIKDKHAHSLAHVDARDLVLWKCSIPADGNLQKTLKTIRFDATDTRLHRLPPASEISELFGTVLPRKTIHVLVELPALRECGTHISYSRLRLDRYLCALLLFVVINVVLWSTFPTYVNRTLTMPPSTHCFFTFPRPPPFRRVLERHFDNSSYCHPSHNLPFPPSS